MKKCYSFAVILALAFSLSACSSGGGGGSDGNVTPTVGQVLPTDPITNTNQPTPNTGNTTDADGKPTATDGTPNNSDNTTTVTPTPAPTPTPNPTDNTGTTTPPPDPTPAPIQGARVEVLPAAAHIPVGGSLQFLAIVLDDNNLPISNGTETVSLTWHSDNSAIASVNTAGIATGVALGTATISLTAATSAQTFTTTATVTVGASDSALGLRVNPSRLALRVGEQHSLNVTPLSLSGGAATLCQTGAQLDFDPRFLSAAIGTNNGSDAINLEGMAPGITFVNLQCGVLRAATVVIEVSNRPVVPVIGGDPAADVGHDIALALPTNGVALSSFDATLQRLVYQNYNSADGWLTEFPGSNNPHGKFSQLLLDPLRGNQPLSCGSDGDKLACWLRNNDGTWTKQTVADFPATTKDTRMLRALITNKGAVWLFYSDLTANAIKWATSTAATRNDWTTGIALKGAASAMAVTLAPDSTPRLALQLSDAAYFGAPNAGNQFQFERVVANSGATALQLVLGNDWVPQIFFLRDKQLWQATKSNNAWQNQIVYTFNAAPVKIDARIDRRNRLRVAYIDHDQQALHLMTGTTNAATLDWLDDSVILGSALGPDAVLQLDSLGRASAAYRRSSDKTAQVYTEPPLFDYGPITAAGKQPSSNAGVQQSAMARPTGLGATAGNGEVALKWSAVTGAARYVLYWNTAGGVTSSSNRIDNLSATTYQHTGRVNGTTYHYAVAAIGDFGESSLSNEAAATPTLPAPQHVHINGDAGSNVLNWDAVPNANSYTVFWNTVGSPGANDASSTVADTQFIHSNINSATPYYYSVRVSDGSSDGALSPTVASITAPTTIDAQAPYQDGSVEVNWPTVTGATSYNVYVSDAPGLSKSTAQKFSNVTAPFVHSDLANQSTWYYAVSAVNSDGESPLSVESSATAIVNNGPLVWRRVSGLPTARFLLASAAVNGNLYSIGGFDGTTILSDVRRYNPAADQWQAVAPLLVSRREHAAVTLNGKIYAIGGWHESSVTSAMEVYDPQLDKWTLSVPMPTARNNLTVAAVNGKIYAIGGWNGSYLNTVEMFDPATNVWTTLANMTTARNTMGSAVIGNKIYVVGGWTEGRTLNDVEVFDTTTNTWSTVALMPTARNRLAVQALNGKLYALGGWDGGAAVNVVEVYDPRTNTWTTSVPMPTGRNGLGSAFLNNKIYTLGGWSGTRYVTNVEAFGAE